MADISANNTEEEDMLTALLPSNEDNSLPPPPVETTLTPEEPNPSVETLAEPSLPVADQTTEGVETGGESQAPLVDFDPTERTQSDATEGESVRRESVESGDQQSIADPLKEQTAEALPTAVIDQPESAEAEQVHQYTVDYA